MNKNQQYRLYIEKMYKHVCTVYTHFSLGTSAAPSSTCTPESWHFGWLDRFIMASGLTSIASRHPSIRVLQIVTQTQDVKPAHHEDPWSCSDGGYGKSALKCLEAHLRLKLTFRVLAPDVACSESILHESGCDLHSATLHLEVFLRQLTALTALIIVRHAFQT